MVKMVKAAHDKMGDNAHWGMYEAAFGTEDGTYIAISGDPHMAVIDRGFCRRQEFVEAMGGEEGMAKLDALFGAAVDSSRSELFAVNPKQSYVSDDWIKADPDFWKPKRGMLTAWPPRKKATKTPRPNPHSIIARAAPRCRSRFFVGATAARRLHHNLCES